MKIFLCTLGLLLPWLTAQSIAAPVYMQPVSNGKLIYVATTGNDANSGTSSSPVRTIQKGVNLANAGDTVVVRNGTYGPEGVVTCGDTCTDENAVVTIDKVGSPTAWLTIKAENKWGAILDCQLQADGYFDLRHSSAYISIEGFDMTRGYWEAIHSNESAHHIVIRNNHFHHIGNRVYNPTGESRGIKALYAGTGTHDYYFDGNVFNNIGRLPGDPSTSYNHDHGLYLYGPNVTVVNNIFYNLAAGWGIQISPGASNYLIANNTFSGSNPQRDGQIILWGNNTGMTIRNNIFYRPRNFAIDTYEAVESGSLIDHNLVYGASVISGSFSGLTVTSNTTGADPLCMNPGAYDFHLNSGSPAGASGVVVPEAPVDMDKCLRPAAGPYSIGAYQPAGQPAPPPPPAATGPTVSLSSSSGPYNAGANITLQAAVTAGTAPVSSVSFYNGAQLLGVISAAPYILAWSGVAAGTYSVYAKAIDTGGLTGTSNTITPTVAAAGGGSGGSGTLGTPAAYWNFNEGTGSSSLDASGNGHTAVLNGAGWTSGHSGSGLLLNGSGYVSVAASASLGTGKAFTVVFWMAPQDVSGVDQRIVANRYNWDVKLNGSAHRPQLSAAGKYAQMQYSAPLATWQHIVFTFSSGVAHGYVNGTEVALSSTFTSGQTIPAQANGYVIGADSNYSSNAKGSLDDVVIYNRALSSAEVNQLYTSGVQ